MDKETRDILKNTYHVPAVSHDKWSDDCDVFQDKRKEYLKNCIIAVFKAGFVSEIQLRKLLIKLENLDVEKKVNIEIIDESYGYDIDILDQLLPQE